MKDAKHTNLHAPPVPIFYSPIFQEADPGSVGVYVRTRQAPEDAASTVRAAVAGIDSKLVIDSLQSMNSEIDATLTSERTLSFLASSFGAIAASHCDRIVWRAGVLHCAAHTRDWRSHGLGGDPWKSHEDGSRRGPLDDRLQRAIAIPLSIALSSLVYQLYGVSYRDPVTLVFVVIAIGVVALLAASLPARRAVRVQPITALRYE